MSLKSLFKQIAEWLHMVPDQVKEMASRSLVLTTNIRNLLDSPIGDILTLIIPGDWDEKLRREIVQHLNEAIPYLSLVNSCKEYTLPEDKLKCWMAELQKHPKIVQDALLHKLASLLTAMQDGNKLKQSLYDLYQQATYTDTKGASVAN